MTTLVDPGYADDHPRQMLHNNLCAGTSMVWFSEAASDRQVLRYVLGLMDLEVPQLLVTSAGFGVTPDESVLIVTTRNNRGSAVCLGILGDGGADKINSAINREWDTMREELSRGEYVGNPVDSKNAAVAQGQVHPDFEGSNVLDFINDAVVTHITGIGLAGE